MAARVRDVVWAESARDALDDVTAYIAQDSQPAAVRVLEAALQAAAGLSTFPERAIRETFVFRYRLMYRVEDTRVVVVAFLHGARDFARWRQQQKPL
jgi:toxin ParE1/3/4